MGIKYDGLFQLLRERKISKTELRRRLGLSSATIAKLAKNEPVSLKVIEDICKELACQPGDILHYEPDNSHNNKLLALLLEEKEMKLKGGLYHTSQIKFAYNSNHIEGSRLSEEQTRYIYETNTLAVEEDELISVDDIIETVNHFRCFDYILDHVNDELSEELIKTCHKILKSNTSDSRKDWFRVGEYKMRPNTVGERKTTSPAKVKGEMARLLIEYNEKRIITLDDILDFHYRFESIHPFQDGNGRVGRLIMFKECLKHNIMPFIIGERHKLYYYRGLSEYENEKGFLRDTCLSAQDLYKELVNYFMKENIE
ncbi:MAG: helix-turn-helix domain-containing protein [Clostridiales bacterium]|nr:helix-turn-helix domain-containing protein [Clostridiales bacterium]